MAQDEAASEPKFAAFISYSHADAKTAKWLHGAIERYRLPRGLEGLGLKGAKLGRVFRDEEELASASELGDTLEAAIRASRTLIVICSPAAVRSKWVGREILTFKRMWPDRP